MKGTDEPEIVVAHGAIRHPVTAVRNVLIQHSLAQLQDCGHYERYASLVDPTVLEQLLASLAPGWIPIELADGHYEACDTLNLSEAELSKLGAGVGDRLQETTLVSTAKKARGPDVDVWGAAASMHRMWPRLYQGGSVQMVKQAQKVALIELLGFRLSRHAYYRRASLTAMVSVYGAVGARIEAAKIVSYNVGRDELVFRLSWA
jgi:hypothetical protein